MILRPASATDGGTDNDVATIDGPPPAATGIGERTWVDKTVCAFALGAAGDALVLKVTYISGSGFFGSISTELTVP